MLTRKITIILLTILVICHTLEGITTRIKVLDLSNQLIPYKVAWDYQKR